VGEISVLEGAKKKADARVEVLEQKVRVFYPRVWERLKMLCVDGGNDTGEDPTEGKRAQRDL
jgi:hypothetical protein